MGTPSHQQLGLESVAVLKVFGKVKKSQFNMSVDADEIRRICDVYDWHGKGELDMYYFMDIFYALGMNSPRKPPSNTDKLMMLKRNSASLMRLSPLSNKLSRSQNTLVTTTTMLSCANCTTKMKMEP